VEPIAKHQALILYEGPSLLDGRPIVVVGVVSGRNQKTGFMVQTYIQRADLDPRDANRTGEDVSICGTCPLRGVANLSKPTGLADHRGCYVQIGQGPLAVYRAYKRGRYQRATSLEDLTALGAGKLVRVGTYGDGAAVPRYVWDALRREAKGHTAYSHQSGVAQSSFDPAMYMVSVNDVAAAQAAWASGARTFRVVQDVSEIVRGQEILCPASKEAGRRVKCSDCLLCGGASVKAKSIAIPTHGAGRKYALRDTVTSGGMQ